jgi:hypothetical protein
VVDDREGVVFDDLYYFADGVFAILGGLFEGPVEDLSICVDPVGLDVGPIANVAARQILQKLRPLDTVTPIDIDILEQFSQLVV